MRSAIACLAIAVVGFAPTYWIPLATGKAALPPLAHVHAFVFYGWLLFYWRQAALAASGRMPAHRQWGKVGAALAVGMLVVGLAMAVHSIRMFDALGKGPEARAFALVPVSAVVLFAGLVAAAVANVRNPETHKRLMFAATAFLLQPAIARVFIFFIVPAGPPAPPPVFVTLGPGILADLVLAAGMIHDKRTRGSVHRVYWYALAAIVAVQVLRVPLSATAGWKLIAGSLVALFP